MVAFVVVVIPGPGVLFIIGRAVSIGRRAALLTVVGHAAGVYVQALAVAAGVGAIVAASAGALTAIRLAGAIYLVWLGVQTIRHRRAATTADAPVERTAHVLRAAFLVGITNAKAIVFFVAVLPQFVEPGAGGVPAQMALLGAIFIALALVTDSAWALAAARARRWFASSPRRLERLTAAGGGVLVGLGGLLASGRQP